MEPSEFARIIRGVLKNPNSWVRNLAGGRTAVYDWAANTLVIVAPQSIDKGTAFRPPSGEHYLIDLQPESEPGKDGRILLNDHLRKPVFVSEPAETHVNVLADCASDPTYRCPCCKAKTLYGRGHYEGCPVCRWEDDGQDDQDADRVRGGPNGDLSLTQARKNYALMGAKWERSVPKARKPRPEEL